MRVRVLSSSLLTIVIATCSTSNDCRVASLLLPRPSRHQHLARRRGVQNGCGYKKYRYSSVGMIHMFGRTALAAKNNTIQENERDSPSFPITRQIMSPLILILLSQFFLFIGVGAVIPSIPLYGKELGFSSATNGVVISIPSVALLLLSKLGGNFADQARKPAMIIGMSIIALSDLGTAVATGLPMLFLARLGLGAGRCVAESGERGMVADLVNQIPALRGRALAAQQACVGLGIAIGAPIGGIIVEEYGPRAAFLCVTVAAILATLMYSFLPETIGWVGETMKDTSKRKSSKQKTFGVQEAEWAGLLAQNKWRGLALCQSGASFGFGAKIAAIPVLATANLPGGAAAAGALLSAAGLSSLIGAPAGGFLTDRAGAKTAAVLSGLLSSVALILVPVSLGAGLDDNNLSLSIGSVVLDGKALAFSAAVVAWSTGAAAQSPSLTALAQELAPKGGEATAMALPKAVGDGTYIMVPFVLGVVTDRFTDIPGIECAVAGAASLLGVVALGLLNDEGLKPRQ